MFEGCGGALGLGPKWRGCCSENQSQFQLQTRVRNASIVALDKKALSTNGCGVGGMMWRATKTGSRKVHTDAFIWRKRERGSLSCNQVIESQVVPFYTVQL